MKHSRQHSKVTSTHKWNKEYEYYASIPWNFVGKRYLEKQKCYLQVLWALENIKESQNKHYTSFCLSSQEHTFGVSSYALREKLIWLYGTQTCGKKWIKRTQKASISIFLVYLRPAVSFFIKRWGKLKNSGKVKAKSQCTHILSCCLHNRLPSFSLWIVISFEFFV